VLGVEGMENDLLYRLFLPYADPDAVLRRTTENPLSKTDLYVDGLTGGEGSAARRDALAERLGLPAGMTPNAFLAALRVLCSYEEYCALVGRGER
jgi:ribonuclease M5